jgi:hypothetical protein
MNKITRKFAWRLIAGFASAPSRNERGLELSRQGRMRPPKTSAGLAAGVATLPTVAASEDRGNDCR